MKPLRRDRWLGGVLALALSATAWGQSVHVVAGDGSGDFLQLQPAVSAAANGDVILVRPHATRYDAAVIEGKSLTIVGDGDVRPELEDLRVTNVGANRVVTLRFLDIEGRNEPNIFGAIQRDGLQLVSNDGCVWLEDLVIAGASGISKLGGFETGFHGLVVDDCDGVVVVDSDVVGGSGGHSVGGTSYAGGDGGRVSLGRVALHGGTFLGGTSGFGVLSPPVAGGAGFDGTASALYASGSSLTGGDTGDTAAGPSPEPSASGLVARDATTVDHLATSFAAGGGPAPPGEPIAVDPSSTVEDLDDAHRAITVSAAIREGKAAQVTYSGQPGDQVLLRFSAEPAWSYVASLKGVQHLGATTADVFLGAAGRTGTLDVTFRGPAPPPGLDALTAFAQPLVAELDGALRLGGPSSVLILAASNPRP